MDCSISVIIACLNEEENVGATCQNVLTALNEAGLDDYEIMIFDDGSTDRTGAIADDIAAGNPKVKVIHNGTNRGFGYNFKRGIELATKTYVAIFPGDNEIAPFSIKRILSFVGRADIVIPHTINMEIRPYGRRFLSRLFTMIMNSIFCCELQYYNGPCVHRRDLLNKIGVNTSGFAFQAVTLTKLILSGYSFIEVEMYLQPKPSYRSSALKWRNVARVVGSLLKLVREIYFDPVFKRVDKIRREQPQN